MYTIQQAADELGVSIHTLRYYEKEGLTPFVKRDSLGARKYSDTDMQWIYMIRCLRDIDMPIGQIRKYIELYLQGEHTVRERQKMMYAYRDFIESRKKALEVCLQQVEYKLTYYDQVVREQSDGSIRTSLVCSDYREAWEEIKDE